MSFIEVKLESFEGPLDLLYKLIEKNEIDIYDIPISKLTDQYLEYINSFSYDMDSLSEFLVMASTLLEIKSKMLLPKDNNVKQNDEDPREDLVRRLIEYKYFKEISKELKEKAIINADVFYKTPENDIINILTKDNQIDLNEILDGITGEVLLKTFKEVILRKELKTDKVRSGFNSVKKDLFIIEDKIKYIMYIVKKDKNVNFKDMFSINTSKIEKIVTFLALLELIKMKQIRAVQNDLFEDINLSLY